ncbi:aminodeoxychorismate lyase [Pelagibaculum spongiae]|uniref:aminodeoxychorismate lyase n=1 Tax=Pelagibaculum spongiae TaxID=2080658 RepID=UPI00131433CC|nr:aminodeoxychorismate lyase [Pelagibaculum spongiae]
MNSKSATALYNGQRIETPPLTRAFCFGDGCFTTLRYQNNRFILLAQHIQRLQRDCRALKITAPDAAEIIRQLEHIQPELAEQAILRITVSRGMTQRGYQPDLQATPELLIQWFAAQPLKQQSIAGWLSDYRLSSQPALAGIKHLNRLDQVMASAHTPVGKEAIMLDQQGYLVEGLSSNLFWRKGQKWFTPELTSCGVHGVAREWLINQLDQQLNLICALPEQLFSADEVIVCNAAQGIRKLESLNDQALGTGTEYQHLQHKLMDHK